MDSESWQVVQQVVLTSTQVFIVECSLLPIMDSIWCYLSVVDDNWISSGVQGGTCKLKQKSKLHNKYVLSLITVLSLMI